MSKLTSFPLPRDKGCPFAPPPALAELRDSDEMAKVSLPDGGEAWIATKYEDIRAVLGDPRFSACPLKPGYPFVTLGRKAQLLTDHPTFPFMDGAEHAKYRRMLTKFFVVPRIEERRSRVEEISNDLLDSFIAAGPGPDADLVERFAFPLPATVLAELLGVPVEDRLFFQRHAKDRTNMLAGAEVQRRAGKALEDYIAGLVEQKKQNPSGDDVISRLISEQLNPEHLALKDLVGIGRLLLVAGHDTTANMIAASVLILLRHPEQMKQLTNDLSLMPQAIEELLRYWTLAHFNSTRVATEDVLIGDTSIKAGEGVVALLMAGNNDPRVFQDPEKFDINRNPRYHLSFAFGPHQCLGQFLARLELEIALTAIFRRLPNLRLAVPISDLKFHETGLNYGVDRLPLSWH